MAAGIIALRKEKALIACPEFSFIHFLFFCTLKLIKMSHLSDIYVGIYVGILMSLGNDESKRALYLFTSTYGGIHKGCVEPASSCVMGR